MRMEEEEEEEVAEDDEEEEAAAGPPPPLAPAPAPGWWSAMVLPGASLRPTEIETDGDSTVLPRYSRTRLAEAGSSDVAGGSWRGWWDAVMAVGSVAQCRPTPAEKSDWSVWGRS